MSKLCFFLVCLLGIWSDSPKAANIHHKATSRWATAIQDIPLSYLLALKLSMKLKVSELRGGYSAKTAFTVAQNEHDSKIGSDPAVAQASEMIDSLSAQIKTHLNDNFPRYLELALSELIGRKPLNKKEKSFMEELRSNPSNLKLLEQYSRWLSDEMLESDLAVEVYKYALLIHPASVRFHYLKAEALANVPDKIYEAESAYRYALMLDPQNVAALTGYGRLLLDEFNDVAGAEAKLEQAVAAAPDDVDALCQRARAHEMAGDVAAAERVYRHAARARPHGRAGGARWMTRRLRIALWTAAERHFG